MRKKEEYNRMLWARPISVTMPQELLDYLDEIADINNMSRSEMMRTLVEEKRREDLKDAGQTD